MALGAPVDLWLAGEKLNAPEVTAAAYEASGRKDRLTIDPDGDESAAVDWLIR